MNRVLPVLLAMLALLPAEAASQATAPIPLERFLALTEEDTRRAATAGADIASQWDDRYAIMLVELLLFAPRANHATIVDLLERGTGQRFGGELERWYEWIWRTDPGSHPDYADFKAALYGTIDPRFRNYFDDRPRTAIRLDEIRWGGVLRDGIPPLDHPRMLSAGEATYLDDDDVVFGIELAGDARAYPKRILAWHEMVRDRIGGEELNGVYCTLCGSMIFYRATIEGTHHVLGTSGFLYRSNKLMYDQATESLWSTLTGRPAVGPLVGQGLALEPLFVVTTTWGEWRGLHPDTRVLSMDTGHRRDYREGAAYREYFASDSLMFGVPRLDARLPNKAEVLAIRASADTGEPLAIAADFLRRHPVYHGSAGELDFVVLTDRGGANRVYASEGTRFVRAENQVAIDAEGGRWTISEAALTGPRGRTRPRLPAHRAFWFGWYSAHPDTRLVH